jgi:hypothetical protein
MTNTRASETVFRPGVICAAFQQNPELKVVQSGVIGSNNVESRSFHCSREAHATRPLRSPRQNSDRSRCRAFHRGKRLAPIRNSSMARASRLTKRSSAGP